MFSLCIPTMDRFDNFLSIYIPKYIDNPLIDEIIITDENGNDYNKIITNFNNEKLKVYKNDIKLGPFLNKLQACKKAKNDWIALIDSDNFIDNDYLEKMKEYIETKKPSHNSILSPNHGMPIFNFTKLTNKKINKSTLSDIIKFDNENDKNLGHLINIGNYVIHKHLISNLSIDNEYDNIMKSSACDVIYMNVLFMEQLDATIHVVDAQYLHKMHDDNSGTYMQNFNKYPEFNKFIYNKFYNIANVDY